jgi:hypothetical protein
MSSRELKHVYKPLRDVIKKALDEADARGLPVIITCTKRDSKEQEALYAQGRESLVKVNSMRKACGLWEITKDENKRKVTWTHSSYHTLDPLSMAVDFAITFPEGKICWDVKADVNNNEITDYKEFGEICKVIDPINIEWGGDWKKPDNPHIQWKNGKFIIQSVKEGVVENNQHDTQHQQELKHENQPANKSTKQHNKKPNKTQQTNQINTKSNSHLNNVHNKSPRIIKDKMPILNAIAKFLSLFKIGGK